MQEAGGIVIGTDGGPYNIMKPNVITACTPQIRDTMLAIAREVDEKIKNEGK